MSRGLALLTAPPGEFSEPAQRVRVLNADLHTGSELPTLAEEEDGQVEPLDVTNVIAECPNRDGIQYGFTLRTSILGVRILVLLTRVILVACWRRECIVRMMGFSSVRVVNALLC